MADEKINVQRIKDARLEKGYSINEMSEMLGYKSYVAYYRKEEGARKFNTNDIGKLRTILDLELNDIFLDNKLPQR